MSLRFLPDAPVAPRRPLLDARAQEELLRSGRVAAAAVGIMALMGAGLALGAHWDHLRIKLLLGFNRLVEMGVIS